jgi:hypothetical protein
MRKLIFLAVLLLATPVIAQEMPKYDAEGACQKLPASLATRAVINDCIITEQNGYDYLKSVWGELTTKARDECGYYIRLSIKHGLHDGYHSAAQCALGNLEVQHWKDEQTAPLLHFHE